MAIRFPGAKLRRSSFSKTQSTPFDIPNGAKPRRSSFSKTQSAPFDVPNGAKPRRSSFSKTQSTPFDVPKGYFVVYVGVSQKKRFVVPITFLSQPLFQELLNMAKEEFGYDHPKGCLTIPCTEDIFVDVTSRLNGF